MYLQLVNIFSALKIDHNNTQLNKQTFALALPQKNLYGQVQTLDLTEQSSAISMHTNIL